MPPTHHLIDVRSPAEFSTGHLTTDISPRTFNVEYTSILSLPSILSASNVPLDKTSDHITLYCRSGRRSAIAKKVLQDEGYVNVRDIGGFDEARSVLDREQVERQLEGMMGEVEAEQQVEKQKEVENEKTERDAQAVKGQGKREKGFGRLIAGLKELEGESG